MKKSFRRLVFVMPVLALILGACGGSGDDDQDAASAQGDFNGTDVSFAAQMLPHHMHAVEMATLAIEKSTNADTKALAQGILDTQEREIATLEGFLETFEAEPTTVPDPVMKLMMAQAEMLRSASGAQFDRAFLEAMSGHHASAIPMAEIEIEGGTYDETVELAKEIRDTQVREIEEMSKIMDELA